MRLPNLSNLVAEISLRTPAIASDREAGERRGCRLPRPQISACIRCFRIQGFSIETEATTVICRLAFQGRVLRVRLDRDAPSVRGATTVAGQHLPIGVYPNRAP